MFHIRLLILILLISANPAFAQESILAEVIKSQEAIVQVTAENTDVFKSKPAIAGINPRTGRLVTRRKLVRKSYDRSGAGVIIHPSGVIVTNAHIVHRANRIKITLFDNKTFYANVVGFQGELDFALLKINTPYPLRPIIIADSDKIELRDEIITIGNSFILNGTVSGGRVRSLGVTRTKSGRQTDLIHTTVNLYQGDSGGPLFNSRGELIGLMTAKETDADHSSFAIPSKKILLDLMEYLNGKTHKN